MIPPQEPATVTYTNENYSVDFSTVAPILINVAAETTEDRSPIGVATMEEDVKDDKDIFANFEISPKIEAKDQSCNEESSKIFGEGCWIHDL